MTDHIIYGLIGFFMGGILGGYLVGSLCGREYRRRIQALQDERDQLVEEQAKTAEKALLARQKAIVEAENDLVGMGIDIPDESSDDEGDEEVVVVKSKAKEFARLSREYKSDAFDEHFENLVSPDDDEPNVTRMITEEEFSRSLDAREHEEITYFQEDGILADESQEVIPNQLDILGEDAMEMIFDTPEDVLYVDNDDFETMFKVNVEHNLSYYRDVLGLG